MAGVKATKQQAKIYQQTLDGGLEEAKPKRKHSNEEAQHQALLFAWRRDYVETYPALRWLFATLNGVFMPPHIRAKAIEAGMAQGILDLFLLFPYEDATTRYCGLAMDLKRLKGARPSAEQLEWAAHLVQAGWLVLFPAGAVDAWRCLCCYLGINGDDHWARELQAREELIRLMNQP
jgi:hypothetical protein